MNSHVYSSKGNWKDTDIALTDALQPVTQFMINFKCSDVLICYEQLCVLFPFRNLVL